MDSSKRKAYFDKISAQIDEWEAKLDVSKAKVAKKVADTKIAAFDQADDLRTRRESLRRKLDELKNTAEDRWEGVKDELESSWGALKDLVARRKNA